MSVRTRALICATACPLLLATAVAQTARAGELSFAIAPALPALPTVTINAKSQTVSTTMTNISVSDTRLLAEQKGWNVTAIGQSGVGKKAVFTQYCPKAKCGATAEGYVAAGFSLAAKSLTLNSTGATFTGGTGSVPALQCAATCSIDSAAAVKIVSTASGEGGTWTSSGFSATSLKLAVPTTLRALPAEEVYRVNILWTLAAGP